MTDRKFITGTNNHILRLMAAVHGRYPIPITTTDPIHIKLTLTRVNVKKPKTKRPRLRPIAIFIRAIRW